MKHLFMSLILIAVTTATVAQNEKHDSGEDKTNQLICDAAASKLRESGATNVVLRVTVSESGRVWSFTTEAPKGLHLEKMKEVATAIKAIRFGPAKKDGRAVAVQIAMQFDCGKASKDH